MSATAYALMGIPDQAKLHLAKAHEGWTPRDAFDRGGMDLATAGVQLDLRRFDTAHQFAASAVRAYGDGNGRERLDPLIAALDARPSNDTRELARTTRSVAAGKPPQIA